MQGEAIRVKETLFPSYLSNDQKRLAVVHHGTQEDPFPFGHTTASSSVAERIDAPESGPSEQPRRESESAVSLSERRFRRQAARRNAADHRSQSPSPTDILTLSVTNDSDEQPFEGP